MSNGLTRMGKISDNQEFLTEAFSDFRNRVISNKTADLNYFGVMTILTNTTTFKTSITLFNSEHDAIEYLDKWIASGKGYAKLLSPKY